MDPDYLFTDLNIGWPDSVHDARVFCHSQLYEQAQSGDILLTTHRKTICGVSVPPYLIGDVVYPLKTWLLTSFPDRTFRWQEEISSCRRQEWWLKMPSDD